MFSIQVIQSTGVVVVPNGATGGGVLLVNPGESELFNFYTLDDYQITDVLLDGVSIGARSNYNFTDISESHSLEVVSTYSEGLAGTWQAPSGGYGSVDIPGCCGVKSVQMAKGQDGTITCTVTGLKEDAITAAKYIIRLFSSSYEFTSWREQGALYTVTVISRNSSQILKKVKKDGHFKTIPSDFYRIYKSGLVYRSILDPLQEPDTDIFIKESTDIYGAGTRVPDSRVNDNSAWTVREIMEELDTHVFLPDGLNYSVYEFKVTRGTPIVNVVRSLFPIPGIMVEWYHGRMYVQLPPLDFPTDWYPEGMCDIEGEQSQVNYYSHIVTGVAGEPRGVDPDDIKTATVTCRNSEEWSNLQEGGTFVDLTITYNLVGGIFSIDYEKTPTYDKQEQLESMFVIGNPPENDPFVQE